MSVWFPSPWWPYPKNQPESPHQAAIADRDEETKPRKRTPKKAED